VDFYVAAGAVIDEPNRAIVCGIENSDKVKLVAEKVAVENFEVTGAVNDELIRSIAGVTELVAENFAVENFEVEGAVDDELNRSIVGVKELVAENFAVENFEVASAVDVELNRSVVGIHENFTFALNPDAAVFVPPVVPLDGYVECEELTRACAMGVKHCFVHSGVFRADEDGYGWMVDADEDDDSSEDYDLEHDAEPAEELSVINNLRIPARPCLVCYIPFNKFEGCVCGIPPLICMSCSRMKSSPALAACPPDFCQRESLSKRLHAKLVEQTEQAVQCKALLKQIEEALGFPCMSVRNFTNEFILRCFALQRTVILCEDEVCNFLKEIESNANSLRFLQTHLKEVVNAPRALSRANTDEVPAVHVACASLPLGMNQDEDH
jgi:hypothetical protein